MAVVGGVRHKLAKGREGKQAAKQRLRELLDVRDAAPDPQAGPLTVAGVIELYLVHARPRYAERSLYERKIILQAFAEALRLPRRRPGPRQSPITCSPGSTRTNPGSPTGRRTTPWPSSTGPSTGRPRPGTSRSIPSGREPRQGQAPPPDDGRRVREAHRRGDGPLDPHEEGGPPWRQVRRAVPVPAALRCQDVRGLGLEMVGHRPGRRRHRAGRAQDLEDAEGPEAADHPARARAGGAAWFPSGPGASRGSSCS